MTAFEPDGETHAKEYKHRSNPHAFGCGIRHKIHEVGAEGMGSAPRDSRACCTNGVGCASPRWHTEEQIHAQLRAIDTKLDFVCRQLSKVSAVGHDIADSPLSEAREQIHAQLRAIDTKLDFVCRQLSKVSAVGHDIADSPLSEAWDSTLLDLYLRELASVGPTAFDNACAYQACGMDKLASTPGGEMLVRLPEEDHAALLGPTGAASLSSPARHVPLLPIQRATFPTVAPAMGIALERGEAHTHELASLKPCGVSPTAVSDSAVLTAFGACGKSLLTSESTPVRSVSLPVRLSSRRRVKLAEARRQASATEMEMAYQARFSSGTTPLERLVTSSEFDSVISCVVLLNTVLLGAGIHHSAVSDQPPPVIYDYLEYACTGIFTFELALRIAGQGRKLMSPFNRLWTALDTSLVAFSLIELFFLMLLKGAAEQIEQAGYAKLLKIARMCRVLRAFRMFRFLVQVRIMVLQVAGSLSALGWFFLLLFFFLYVFGVIITSGATGFLKPENGDEVPRDHPEYQKIKDFYGGVFQTMYTLFMCITSGVSWGEPGKAALAARELYFAVFCVFIFSGIFSVLNVITGVFVDSAIQQAETDRVVRLQKAQRARKEMEKALTELFKKLDIDNDEFIKAQEWWFACERPEVRSVLPTLEIGDIESEDIFDLLDIDHDGVLRCAEFMEGLTMIRGLAKSVDLYRLSMDVRNMAEVLDHVAELLVCERSDERLRAAATV